MRKVWERISEALNILVANTDLGSEEYDNRQLNFDCMEMDDYFDDGLCGETELQEVLRKFGDNEYYNLDGDMEILYDEDKKWYLRYDSGYGKLEIKFRTVKNLIKDREDSYTKK